MGGKKNSKGKHMQETAASTATHCLFLVIVDGNGMRLIVIANKYLVCWLLSLCTDHKFLICNLSITQEWLARLKQHR